MARRALTAALLTAAVVVGSLVAPNVTSATEAACVREVSQNVPDVASGLPDNVELFDGYVNGLFYGNERVAFFATSGRDQLTDEQKQTYDVLEDVIVQIAAGSRERTDNIALPGKTWTFTELGVTSSSDARDAAFDLYMSRFLGNGRVFEALFSDHPYELYWFDKTSGYSTNLSTSSSGQSVTVSAQVKMSVAVEYQKSSDLHCVDSTDVSRAQSAAATAKSIVAKHADEPDYEKLVSYKNEICELVSYDTAAALDESTPYGDPWQLVSVFDANPSTNVVCEGYAKAFQYLFDESDFTSTLLRCITVSGSMAGGTGAGPHMWNVVRLDDGQSYLVDVTNSDKGSVGQDGGLFLASYDAALGNAHPYSYSNALLHSGDVAALAAPGAYNPMLT